MARRGVTPEVGKLILASWSSGTQATYSTPINKWVSYCKDKNILDPYNASFQQGMDFLAFLFNKGLSYSYLAVIRSALSAIFPRKDGVPFGKHPDVSRILRGVFISRPSIPKSSKMITFDVSIVLTYMAGLPKNEELNLEELTKKTATLLCLLSGQRAQTISVLKTNENLMHKCKNSGKNSFAVSSLLKHSKPGKHQDPLEFLPYPHNSKICPVECINAYLDRTNLIRENSCENGNFFISYSHPFGGITSAQTIARYVRSFLVWAGIDISFTAHSTRSASTSKANNEGLSLKDINSAAGWSNKCETFRKHYNKPLKRNFGNVILNSLPSSSSATGGSTGLPTLPATPMITEVTAKKIWRPYDH